MITDFNHYLTDQEFYTYVKFLDLIVDKHYEGSDENSYSLRHFSLGREDIYRIFKRLNGFTNLINLPVTVSVYSVKEEDIREKIDERDESEKKDLDKILQKILKEKPIKFSDVAPFSWVHHDLYSSVYFHPNTYTIPVSVREKIIENVNQYLDNLINNKLAIVKKNYYRFDLQKQCLISLIEEEKMIALYGSNFIIREGIDEHGNVKRQPDFCILQTLYALQLLGYLKVNSIWEETVYKREYTNDEKDKNRYICINVTLEEEFIREINSKYRKENPKNVIDGFDLKTGILQFAGEDINLSTKGKETDAALLMESLLKADGDDWKFNDEIFGDWKYNEADIKNAPKNKIYFAAQKINTSVAVKTKIENLIEYTTAKARINPRYRKVDE